MDNQFRDVVPIFTTSHNQFHKLYNLFFTKNGTSCTKFSKWLPMTSSTKILMDLSCPPLECVYNDCLYAIIIVTYNG